MKLLLLLISSVNVNFYQDKNKEKQDTIKIDFLQLIYNNQSVIKVLHLQLKLRPQFVNRVNPKDKDAVRYYTIDQCTVLKYQK